MCKILKQIFNILKNLVHGVDLIANYIMQEFSEFLSSYCRKSIQTIHTLFHWYCENFSNVEIKKSSLLLFVLKLNKIYFSQYFLGFHYTSKSFSNLIT